VNELENVTGQHGRDSSPASSAVSQVLREVLAHSDKHGNVSEPRLQSEHSGVWMWTKEQNRVAPAEFLVPARR
jgi:hypothetical protein